MQTPKPPHPVHALTTGELAGYQRQLEEAINDTAPDAPAQAGLLRQLGDVHAERQSRAAIAASTGRARP